MLYDRRNWFRYISCISAYKKFFADTAEDVLKYVERKLTQRRRFYSAEDAESAECFKSQ
jgi:uncharacterized protein YyaL (SSP411 family)